ncbi:uncharacterized protein PHACADRAFT_188777 [Phanerochaete carnosa HHB-10118-sp]|uniref:F-box domain-containing protein n=1 Tax=Phanerochaete carnosa (strain HHB-10118-sp) TaxID=650164 RepID=K5WHM4_PHACS|nr:uncharacterized protein PHACADRAFT_188777 [Phanerochaete carnosa HHB-10118-sp]EKM49732.1 hypothetical protein PHACADRAFT_188777 [Phanerochaete carnosa HHB-10118-sp]
MFFSGLPEEMISRILSQAIRYSLHSARIYNPWAQEDFIKPRRVTDVVLVCKSWNRIGMPFLCEHLSMSTPEHTANVAKVLRAKPKLGRHVKHMRLRGGFSPDLLDIVRLLPPRLEHLWISVGPDDGAAFLLEVLPMLNPRTLHLNDPLQPFADMHRRGATMKEAIRLIMHLIATGKWALLVQEQYMCIQRITSYYHKTLTAALAACPTLQQVKYDYRTLDHTALSKIILNPNLKRMICVIGWEKRRGYDCLERLLLPWVKDDAVLRTRAFQIFGFCSSFEREDWFEFCRDMSQCRENLARNDPPVSEAMLKERTRELAASYGLL